MICNQDNGIALCSVDVESSGCCVKDRCKHLIQLLEGYLLPVWANESYWSVGAQLLCDEVLFRGGVSQNHL